MTRNYPISKDTWPAASAYTGKTFSVIDMVHWMEDVGDQLETLQDWAGYYLDTDTAITLAGRMLAAEEGYRYARTAYTPTLNGNGLTTTTSTWTGNYFRAASSKVGLLSITGAVTGNWAGSGFISISLPSGWTAQATHECAVITGWCAPKPNVGLHVPLIGVVHPGDTQVRVIAPSMVAQSTVATGAGPGYCTATASTDLFACIAAHGLSAGDAVRLTAADATAFPTGVTIGQTGYVIASGLTGTAYKLSATLGGSAIDITVDGTAIVQKTTTVQSTPYWFAVDGVATPFAFTGDGTLGNQDEIHLTGYVLLA